MFIRRSINTLSSCSGSSLNIEKERDIVINNYKADFFVIETDHLLICST